MRKNEAAMKERKKNNNIEMIVYSSWVTEGAKRLELNNKKKKIQGIIYIYYQRIVFENWLFGGKFIEYNLRQLCSRMRA